MLCHTCRPCPPSTLPCTLGSSLGCCTRFAKSGSPATHKDRDSAPGWQREQASNKTVADVAASPQKTANLAGCSYGSYGTDRSAQPAGEVRPRNMTTRSPSSGGWPGRYPKASCEREVLQASVQLSTWVQITKLVAENHGRNLPPSLGFQTESVNCTRQKNDSLSRASPRASLSANPTRLPHHLWKFRFGNVAWTIFVLPVGWSPTTQHETKRVC